MSNHVFSVSEWLPKPGQEQALRKIITDLLAHIKRVEPGCLHARVTHQLVHPGAPTVSKFPIVLLQEYESFEAFDEHCSMDYVKEFFDTYVSDEETRLVEDWRCRLFTEDEI